VKFLKRRAAVNSERYVKSIKGVRTTNSKVLTKQEDESRPRRPYSPNSAPSDFHIFGPLKDVLRGRLCADEEKLKLRLQAELGSFSKEFHVTGIQSPTQGCTKYVDNKGELVEK
jgi:hypothetical protein